MFSSTIRKLQPYAVLQSEHAVSSKLHIADPRTTHAPRSALKEGTRVNVQVQAQYLRSPGLQAARYTSNRKPAPAKAMKKDVKGQISGSSADHDAPRELKSAMERFSEAQDGLRRAGVSVKQLLTTSLLVGVTFGTAFQVTHNNGYLPVYDKWAFQIGPFLESGLVPFVLAPIWLLYSYAFPLLDHVFASDEMPERRNRSSLQLAALTWLLCAAQFIISDYLYLENFAHSQIYVISLSIMAACTAIIWWSTDRTKTGVVLGSLLAIGAPLVEAVIVALGLWHYDRPDNPLGVCFWTGKLDSR